MKKVFIVTFKDGTTMEVEALVALEAEHVAGVARRRMGLSSAVENVRKK
jgi:hypothetical protein